MPQPNTATKSPAKVNATAGAATSQPTNGAPKAPRLKKDGTPRSAPGPQVAFNADRDRALVLAARQGGSVKTITEQLKSDPAFEGVGDALSAPKVIRRLGVLRKAGVNLSRMSRTTYKPAADDLNALLAENAAQ